MADPHPSTFMAILAELEFMPLDARQLEFPTGTISEAPQRPDFIWITDERDPDRALTIAWDDAGNPWQRIGTIDLRERGFPKLDDGPLQ